MCPHPPNCRSLARYPQSDGKTVVVDICTACGTVLAEWEEQT